MEHLGQTPREFLHWFWKKLKSGICPHCGNPISQTIQIGYRVHSDPCGCELYRGTVEQMKVVSLDEYRKARFWYRNIRSKYPDIRLSFRTFCIFRTRYSGYIRAMRNSKENFSKNLYRARK